MYFDELFTFRRVGIRRRGSLLCDDRRRAAVLEPVTRECSEGAGPASPPVLPAQVPEFDFGAIYEKYYRLMISVAVRRFHICEMDAQTLAHEVFFDFLGKGASIADPRGWLVGAVCNASRYYLRKQARAESLPDTIAEEPDPELARVLEMWPNQLAAREAFARTTARCQLVLRLRYLEGYSIPEIARELGTTKKYAAKLVAECLKQAHRRYARPESGVGA
jgi:RNA polymerase sigma factor (sigma-70 family)